MKKIWYVCMYLFTYTALYSQTQYPQINEALAPYEGMKGIDAITSLLIEGIDATDSDGWTPIFFAVAGEYKNIVDALIAKGANVNSADEDDWTPHNVSSSNK